MVFSSLIFLLYFLPFFLLFYYLSPRKLQNTFALLASCFFYAWGEPEFFFLVFTFLIVDFYLVRLTYYSTGKRRKRLLFWTLFFDILMLAVFKYLNFFIDNVNVLLSGLGVESLAYTGLLLPIGISFITFQKISYVLDCYQGRSKPLDGLVDYALYIMLFPQLIAGPIVRFNEIANQLKDRQALDHIDARLSGLFRFVIGLAKKVLIADSLGLVVDEIFSISATGLNTPTAWLGILAYSFQIYFDFSGYSDMAIGLAKMIGFRFPENFNFPYISKSITEFWRRWHITLSNWMRDYLYIPLGGNRVSQNRLYFNLTVVFLFSGLWHGAAWTFVFWGAFHGLFLILDRLFLVDALNKLGKIPAILITYFIVLIGWIFFRSPDFTYAFQYLGKLFAFQGAGLIIYIKTRFWLMFLLAIIFSFYAFDQRVEKWANDWFKPNTQLLPIAGKMLLALILGWLSLLEIYGSDFNPFIYFKF